MFYRVEEFFISKKKKNGDIYLVSKSAYGLSRTVSIKIPDELRKVIEKNNECVSLLSNKITLFKVTSNPTMYKKQGKEIIMYLLPEEKYRKMLFISFVFLFIKKNMNSHISIDKDIFERFKITDTKASYKKLYDIADFSMKLYLGNINYNTLKNAFSLN